MQHRIYVNIGSNSGHRHALIRRAVAAVSSALPGVVRCSDIIETEPWGFDSPNTFLNIGLMIETESVSEPKAFAEDVFRTLRSIEKDIDPSPHRDSSGAYIDRKIDIDLIAVDDVVLSTPNLTLPHPQMHLRDFVLVPMAQLDPSWLHPLFLMTSGDMARRIKGC